MSKIIFSPNLFLEVAEFLRFQKFMEQDGFKRRFLLNTDNFGLIKQANLPDLGNVSISENFYVEKSGTPFDEVTINKGLAIDLNGNVILNSQKQSLKIPNDSLWYWIKTKYAESSLEQGTVSIDANGNCTGTGTKFTEILRGQPNFPTKIKFPNTINGNADEYEVVKVISDTSCILQGDFNSENRLNYSVIGTFTRGSVQSESDKNIYRYDSCNITLVAETSIGQPPIVQNNMEFYLARVRFNGTNLSLQDKRTQWYQTEAMNEISNLNRNLVNPLIGVEAVKYDVSTATKANNIIELAFGFRFTSWTIDTSSKRLSILIGNGGVYKSTANFRNGDFNGWRLYSKNGKYKNIVDSIKTGTQIVVTLDVMNPEDYIQDDLLFICPPYEEIEIRVRKDGAVQPVEFPLLNEIHSFNINTPIAKFRVPAQKGCYKFNLTYRYKTLNDYSDWLVLPNDVVGHYKEIAFDTYGNLNIVANPNVRYVQPYNGHLTNGFITVCEHPYSYDNFQNLLNTGDLFGVNSRQFSNAEPLINLQVTKDKKYQHFHAGNYSTLALNSDFFINLKSYKDDFNQVPCREGNEFFIHIEQWIDIRTFKLRIVQNYVNPTQYTLLAELNENDIAYIKNNVNENQGAYRRGLFIRVTFNDQGKWICHYDTETTVVGTVRMHNNIGGMLNGKFDSSGNGIATGFFGWRILRDMDDRFPLGTGTIGNVGNTGGSNTVTINSNNIPEHDHFMFSQVGGNQVDVPTPYSMFQNNNDWGNKAYQIRGNENAPTMGKTSKYGVSNPTPVNIRPKFRNLLFIEKYV